MTATYLTLADLTKVNDRNLADRDISDILNDAQRELLAADICPDTTHKYLKQTGAPVVGFRSVNDGRENSKSADTLMSVDLKILDASFDVDKALADAYKDGPDAFVAREAMRSLKQSYFMYEKQIFNGTVEVQLLASRASRNSPGNWRSHRHQCHRSSVGAGSSVYAIRTGGDPNDVVAIAGKSGDIQIGDTTVIQKAGATTGTYPALYTPITGWVGLQIGGAYSVGRICNLTAQAGKTLTDALIAQLIATFPAGKGPTHLAMNRRSLFQLQAARTEPTRQVHLHRFQLTRLQSHHPNRCHLVDRDDPDLVGLSIPCERRGDWLRLIAPAECLFLFIRFFIGSSWPSQFKSKRSAKSRQRLLVSKTSPGHI